MSGLTKTTGEPETTEPATETMARLDIDHYVWRAHDLRSQAIRRSVLALFQTIRSLKGRRRKIPASYHNLRHT